MWRSRMFWRLFGAYSLVLAAGLGVLGWTLTRRVEAHLLEEIRHHLDMRAILVRELAAGPGLAPADRQQQLRRVAEETGSRITLITADGRVLADSAEDPGIMDNHLDRPEVRQAEATGTGTATRYSTTVHQQMMYVARRVDLAEGARNDGVRYVRLALPLGAVEEEIGWLQRVVWTAAGATMLLALFLSLILARRMSAPLVNLADAARSVSGGAYGTRVAIASRDEVGTLAAAFNEMSQACAAHIAQMEQDRQQLRTILGSMVEGVLVLDAEQRVLFLNEAAGRLLGLPPGTVPGRKLWQLVRHRQLNQAVEQVLATDQPHRCELEWLTPEPRVFVVHGSRLPDNPRPGAVLVLHDITHLRKLERVRQDFVANVSHELKTPLAAIQAMVETLLDGALQDPDHNTGFLERIRENADRLHRLVQDLLTLGRIESGAEVLDVQPLPVQAAVDASLARIEQRAAAKQLALALEPPAEPVAVLSDDEALAEILDNLVDNAIKYTPAGGRVTVRWFAEGPNVVLQVDDTGIGIPEKDLPRIFERFYRVDKARSREVGGTGLGLSIVKHLVQALGGNITATSRPGEGSTFTLRLPRAESPVEPSEVKSTETAPDIHRIYTDQPYPT